MQKIKEAVLSSKGQITVPKAIREILHVEGHELFHVLSSVIPGIMKDNINVIIRYWERSEQ